MEYLRKNPDLFGKLGDPKTAQQVIQGLTALSLLLRRGHRNDLGYEMLDWTAAVRLSGAKSPGLVGEAWDQMNSSDAIAGLTEKVAQEMYANGKLHPNPGEILWGVFANAFAREREAAPAVSIEGPNKVMVTDPDSEFAKDALTAVVTLMDKRAFGGFFDVTFEGLLSSHKERPISENIKAGAEFWLDSSYGQHEGGVLTGPRDLKEDGR